MTILSFLLYFTFTLPKKSLKTGTKPSICAFTSKKEKKKKANTLNNIEIKWLHFALHYRPWTWQLWRASVRSYLQSTLKLLQRLLLDVYARVYLPNAEQGREALLNKHRASDIPDGTRHSVGNTGERKAARSLTSHWQVLSIITYILGL